MKTIKIPAKVDNKIITEVRSLQEKTIQIIKTLSEEDWVKKHHHGMGLFIRNKWGLWSQQGEVYTFFKKNGITHADDMSSIILAIIHRRVNDKPDNIDELIQYYIEYWEKKISKEQENAVM